MPVNHFSASWIFMMRSLLAIFIATLAIGTAFAQTEVQSPQKNSWIFTVNNKPQPHGWLFVTIKPNNGTWAIESLGRTAPESIRKESLSEPFLVSPDFQQWSNYYTDNIGNCDSFNVQDSPYKNVCFSQFTGKNKTKAFVGLFFGGNGVAGQRYDADLVNKAINSIDPEDALRKLELLERGG